MMFGRKYPRFDEGLLWNRITKYVDNAVREAMAAAYGRAKRGELPLAANSAPAERDTYYYTKGGQLAYVIGPMASGNGWIGYLVDTKHQTYHEFNEWWPDGSNCSAGEMRVFDLHVKVPASALPSQHETGGNK